MPATRIAVALLLAGAAAPLAAQAAPPAATTVPALAGTRLDIVARGEVRRVPDLATIGAGVVTQAATAREALAANATAMTRVVAALRRAGIAERDIQTASIGLDPQYRYAEGQPPALTGYQARNSVSVRFRDIAQSGTILDALVGVGANQINGPTLGLADPSAALDAARADALTKARARADLYARSLGMRVVRILSVSEAGQFAGPQPMPVMAMARDRAETQVVPGEQEVGIDLTVSFELR